jgi:hypothetical protein
MIWLKVAMMELPLWPPVMDIMKYPEIGDYTGLDTASGRLVAGIPKRSMAFACCKGGCVGVAGLGYS